MIKQNGKTRIAIAPTTLLLFGGMLAFDKSGICAATLLAAFVHELGHLAAARRMRIPLESIRFDPLGARICVKRRMLSYGQEWLLAAMGPLFSLLASLAAAPLWRGYAFARAFSCASLLLGMLNLLPVSTFDGGRMTEVALGQLLGARAAFIIMRGLTFLLLLFLWSISVYLLLRIGGGLSLLSFSVSLFFRFLENGKIG